MLRWIRKNEWILYVLPILLAFPALLINLGLTPFHSDEPTRGLVALEMMLSGNYITPTINGEFYYNKPPVYNWILILFYKLSGNVDEITTRIPTIVFLILFCFTIFYYTRRHFNNRIAILLALVYLSCGRILFWDSMLGLIDICYSWLIFLNFILIYELFRKEKFLLLFLISYAIIAVTFLMKGLPSLVFQGITLLVFFGAERKIKKLFTLQHVAGILLMLLLIGTYYYTYHQYNDIIAAFKTLYTESSKRTVIRFGWWQTILHIFIFPFEMIYHFAPWSLFVIVFFRKGFFKELQQAPFVKYCLYIFMANIIIYWVSPEVFPRYLLMLIPLIFIAFIHFYYISKKENTVHYKIIDGLLITLALISTVFFLYIPEIERVQDVRNIGLTSYSLFVILAILSTLLIRMKNYRILIMVSMLLVGRIGYNLILLPERNAHNEDVELREEALTVGRISGNKPVYVYGTTPLNHHSSLYIARTKHQIVKRVDNFDDKDAYYIVYRNFARKENVKVYYNFRTRYRLTELSLIKPK